MVNDLLGGIRMAVGVVGVRGRALEEVEGRWRRQRLGFDLDGGQDGGGDVVGLHFHVGLGAQHVRVLRVELLYARGDVLPERRPEEHIVVVGRRLMTPRRDEARLGPAHRPPNLEKVLHLDRGLPRLLLRVILVEFLQPVEVLSAQQRVQVRGLLEIERAPRVVDMSGWKFAVSFIRAYIMLHFVPKKSKVEAIIVPRTTFDRTFE